APALLAPLPDKFEQAKVSHHKFHQNTPGLVRQFQLTRDQAKAIVATCPQCQNDQMPALSAGANPRGLHRCEELRRFLQQWGVEHITGIPHSPTGQAIVERTYQSLKKIIEHQRAAMKVESPHVQLAQALTIRAGNTGAGVCVYCHSYRVKMGSCKMDVPIYRQAGTSHTVQQVEDPWFGDTYPNSEFLPPRTVLVPGDFPPLLSLLEFPHPHWLIVCSFPWLPPQVKKRCTRVLRAFWADSPSVLLRRLLTPVTAVLHFPLLAQAGFRPTKQDLSPTHGHTAIERGFGCQPRLCQGASQQEGDGNSYQHRRGPHWSGRWGSGSQSESLGRGFSISVCHGGNESVEGSAVRHHQSDPK
ncbi:hypothetical protein DV515_00019270, partial [Chloebia gouldiae]